MSNQLGAGYQNCEDTDPKKTQKQIVPTLLKPAPYWKGTAIVNTEFKEISLTDYKGKYLVFFFYPYDFTYVCPTEIIQFSDRIEEFRSIGTSQIFTLCNMGYNSEYYTLFQRL